MGTVPELEPALVEIPAVLETQPIPEPTEAPVVPAVQPTWEPSPTPNSVADSAPSETSDDPQHDSMVYVEGFGWLESQGEGMVIHNEIIYENGNKVGSMD